MAITLANTCAIRYDFIDKKSCRNSLPNSWNQTTIPD